VKKEVLNVVIVLKPGRISLKKFRSYGRKEARVCMGVIA
jgi:hypothetical protein